MHQKATIFVETKESQTLPETLMAVVTVTTKYENTPALASIFRGNTSWNDAGVGCHKTKKQNNLSKKM